MPKKFEVLFNDKKSGSEIHFITEWNSQAHPNLNYIVRRGFIKVCDSVHCKPSDLVFCSLKVI